MAALLLTVAGLVIVVVRIALLLIGSVILRVIEGSGAESAAHVLALGLAMLLAGEAIVGGLGLGCRRLRLLVERIELLAESRSILVHDLSEAAELL